MGPKFIKSCKYQDVQNRNTFERIHKLDFQRCFTNNFTLLGQLLFYRIVSIHIEHPSSPYPYNSIVF